MTKSTVMRTIMSLYLLVMIATSPLAGQLNAMTGSVKLSNDPKAPKIEDARASFVGPVSEKAPAKSSATVVRPTKVDARTAFNKLPFSFEPNLGQEASAAEFISHHGPADVSLLPSGIKVSIHDQRQPRDKFSAADLPLASHVNDQTVAMDFVGASPHSHIEGLNELSGKTNYFVDSNPENWRSNIPNFQKVKYSELYPGIDAIFYGSQRQLEYDFVIHPGADAAQIKLGFAGADEVRINREGDLVLKIGNAELRQAKPILYQEIRGKRKYLAGSYRLTKANELIFEIGRYDRSQSLIIDPQFIFATYFGSLGEDNLFSIAVDGAGAIYVTGYNYGPVQRVVVAKLNATGTALAYLTYLGGSSGNNEGRGIAVNKFGEAYLTGWTSSATFPITGGGFQTTKRGWASAFVARLTPAGVLASSTFFGGGDQITGHGEFGLSIALDAASNTYITGEATSIDMPVRNAYQSVRGGARDNFFAKFNSTLSSLLVSSYLGGSNTEGGALTADFVSGRPGNRIAVDAAGNFYLAGYSSSIDFPVYRALQPAKRNEDDAYIAKFDTNGLPIYVTFFGGSGTGNDFAHGDFAYAIACDAEGAAYVAGDTTSNDLMIVGGIQSHKNGARDIFFLKINPQGTAIVYSSYFGGSDGNETADGIAVDRDGQAIIIGVTSATNFPTQNLLQPARGGGDDAFLLKVSANDSSLIFSSYIGGTSGDQGNAVAVDDAGNIFAAGYTASTNFPVKNALQPANAGTPDGWIAKIDSTVFSVIAIVSNHGGNNGEVSVSILGGGFQPGATVRLRTAGQPDIAGSLTIVNDASSITSTFDLRGATTRLCDVLVTLSNGSTTVLKDGFRIEEGGSIQPWIDVIGRSAIRNRVPATFEALVGNRGTINSSTQLFWIAVPQSATVSSSIPYLTDIGLHPNDPQAPIDGLIYLWFMVDKLGPDEVRSFSFTVTTSVTGQFDIHAGSIEGSLIFSSSLTHESAKKAIFTTKSLAAQFAVPTADDLRPGNLVFKLSDAGEKIRTGHVGIYVGNNEVVDMVKLPGTTGDGYYRKVNISEWATGDTYVGASRPSGLSDEQAIRASQEALNLYNNWIAAGAPTVPYLAPAGFGSNDCVSTVANIYRAAGLTPSWEDAYPPGAVYELTTDKKWPEKNGIWQAMNLTGTKVVEGGFKGLINPAVAWLVKVVAATDPNDKVGTVGYGSSRFVSGGTPLRYGGYFENTPDASAAAQEVMVVDPLDLSLVDPSSFELGSIIIGNKQIIPPPASTSFIGTLDLRPAKNLLVKVTANFNKQTGLVTWRFTSIDPATGLATSDPLAGFLPPDTNPPDGEGAVFFTVNPRSGLPTGTEIRNQASIVFDNNPAIATPVWMNTLDNSSPTSHVGPLDAMQNSPAFDVQWSGTDSGAGIKDYTVFVSENGQPFIPWLSNVTSTHATFTGQTGSTYSFFSIARDLSDNLEDSKTAAEATTVVLASADLSIADEASSSTVVTGSNVSYSITVTNHGPAPASSVSVTDTLPVGTTLISCASTSGAVCGGSGSTRTVDFQSLAPNTSETITILAAVDCSLSNATSITNVATVDSVSQDSSLNNNSAAVTVTVANPSPVIACAADIRRPNDPGQASAVINYSPPVVSDNCLSAVVGCSRPSGTAFPIGATAVACTATDSAGAQSSCSFTITVDDAEPPVISTCPAARALVTNGSNQITLPDLTSEIVAADNYTPRSALSIRQSPPPGTIIGVGTTLVTIAVKDAANNVSTCVANINVTRFALRNFVVFSSESSTLGPNSRVITGGVAANLRLDVNGRQDDRAEVEIGEGVRMLELGSNVVGDKVRLHANAQVQNAIYNYLLNTHGSILGESLTPLLLPVLVLPALPSISPGLQDIEVQPNQSRVIAPGRYRKVTVRNNGMLIMTGGTYELDSLDVRQDANVVFRKAAEVRIKNEMDTGAGSYIGPDVSAPGLTAAQIIFYAEGPDDRGRRHEEDRDLTPTIIQIGQRSTVFANFFAPTGTVWLKSDTKATGAFIGKRVRIGERVELKLASAF